MPPRLRHRAELRRRRLTNARGNSKLAGNGILRQYFNLKSPAFAPSSFFWYGESLSILSTISLLDRRAYRFRHPRTQTSSCQVHTINTASKATSNPATVKATLPSKEVILLNRAINLPRANMGNKHHTKTTADSHLRSTLLSKAMTRTLARQPERIASVLLNMAASSTGRQVDNSASTMPVILKVNPGTSTYSIYTVTCLSVEIFPDLSLPAAANHRMLSNTLNNRSTAKLPHNRSMTRTGNPINLPLNPATRMPPTMTPTLPP